MAWVFGGKHFGEYTYEHWFDDEYEYEEVNTRKGAVMQKETITLFMNYNRSVNNAMNDIIKTLSTEEWEKPLGGFFPSVRGLCSHIYICDYSWLKRFRNIRPFIALNDAFFDSTYSFTETLFEDMGEYFAKRLELDSRMIAFADELTDTDIDSTINYTDSEGNAHKRNFGGCLLHFLNHETHHRGMISLYLEMLGRENDFCSLARVLS